jgi:hypothetical protein
MSQKPAYLVSISRKEEIGWKTSCPVPVQAETSLRGLRERRYIEEYAKLLQMPCYNREMQFVVEEEQTLISGLTYRVIKEKGVFILSFQSFVKF